MLNVITATFRARWVFPIESPPIQDGVVRVANGRIVWVGKYLAGETATDLGNVALLPGFINAHTHLEFSLLERPLGRPGMAFADWIGEVVAFRRGLAEAREDPVIYVKRATAAGLREFQEAGVAAIGEIASPFWRARDSYDSSGPLCGVIFRELLGLSPERIKPLLAAAKEHLEKEAEGNFLRGLSPHAPYTVHPELLQKVCELSAARKIPLAMHLAESFEELELLRSQSGPLVERLKELGAWHPGSLPRGLRPLDYLEMLAAADRSLAIHGNYLVREEMKFLVERRNRMSVVYCPRTHAFFGHGDYPLAEMLACGVRVAVGTDSRASNPDLSILAELRHIARTHPTVPPADILKMGTLCGAEALGLEQETGTITPGKKAVLAVVPLDDSGAEAGKNDSYDLLFHSTAPAATLKISAD